MKTLVFSDVHGNLDALETVLDDAGQVDAVICLGDLVGYGPKPNEVVERVRALNSRTCLVGNHDLAALGLLDLAMFNAEAAQAALWTTAHLEPEHRDWLLTMLPAGSAEGAYLAHASPRDPVWEYMDIESQGPPNFAMFSESICFVGHTHVPRLFEWTAGKRFTPVHPIANGDRIHLGDDVRMIINPGSVGQPRDGDWRASYGIWETEEGWFELHRVEYPVEQTQHAIAAAGLPAFLAARLSLGR